MRFYKLHGLIFIVSMVLLVSSCSMGEACPVTKPSWIQPPEDVAVSGVPGYGYYFVNEDRSIWAAAWWEGQDENYLVPGEDIKTGWFRPAGVDLAITGQRLDAKAPPLEAQIPCCYPTRFQASGLYFPTKGCWEITAQAGDSRLNFVVEIEP